MSIQRLNTTPMQVVADFLAEVRKILVKSVEQTYLMEDIPIMTIITIPAIWNDMAKDLMVQAAVKAGFGVHRLDFQLISEPEAAAAYTLKGSDAVNLCVGDSFVICDAGGGTVDLISYKITGQRPLRLEEVVRGSGGMCGSVYLDYGFEKHIKKVLGEEAFNNMKPNSRAEMMRTWEESVKFVFGHDDDPEEEYLVAVPGIPDCDYKNIADGFYIMDRFGYYGILFTPTFV